MKLENARSALEIVADVVAAMANGLADQVEEEGRLSRSRLDDIQPQAFELARCLAELEAGRAILRWAEAQARDYESGLAAVYVAQVARNLGRTLVGALPHYGLSNEAVASLSETDDFVADMLSTRTLLGLAKTLKERQSDPAGNPGLDEDHIEMSQMFARFAAERVAPLAEHIHNKDQLIPENLLRDLADLGVFGISIPENYGGHFVDHLTMIIATEELSQASLGAGGSVITRPEICAKALLEGGTEEQKQRWLPQIAAGKRIVSIAVTEPDAGSDVANLRVAAKPVDGGFRLTGEKTWCTFAGRADLFAVLARTGTAESGHRGLTLFLAEKPAPGPDDDQYHFVHTQSERDGLVGRVEGHAIPTVGYRGMHSFSVTFDDYFVPAENQIGSLGRGFVLQMKGFAGGRIQTAARAVGVMEAAFRKAVEYTRERRVFKRTLDQFALPQTRLVEMATVIQACRQLAYHVGRLMDDGKGAMEASLVKLLSCKQAEWVTREAMQLHGGMGYSEEYAVSRYWQDARVLSIFEGAEEVLALYVVARQHLKEVIATRD